MCVNTNSDNIPKKAVSIVIPLQFYKKAHNSYSRNLFFSKFYKCMKEHIKCEEEGLEWVEVIPDNVDYKGNHIKYSEAFENDENMTREKEYFCREFFDSLYDYGKKKSCHRMVMLKNTIGGGNAVELTDKKISLYFEEEKSNLLIRKVYLMTYTSFNGLLVVELACDDNEKPMKVKDSLLRRKINVKGEKGVEQTLKELEKYLLGSEFSRDDDTGASILYFRPFKHNRFVVLYDEDNIKEPYDYEISTEGICQYVENRCEFEDFFSYYFQMFLNCIYVKTELFNLSMLASGLAGSWIINSFMVTSLIREYILFINKHCQAECTYNETGQKTFEYLRDQMEIKRIDDYVNAQINAFNNHSSSITGIIVAMIGAVFAFAQVVAALVQIFQH